MSSTLRNEILVEVLQHLLRHTEPPVPSDETWKRYGKQAAHLADVVMSGVAEANAEKAASDRSPATVL